MTPRHETILWRSLSEKGLVAGDEPAQTEGNAPWYVRTMLGIAGWVGALFMLGAVFSGIAMLFDSAVAAGVLGLIACILAVIIYRSLRNNDFMAQFGFAISLAGQGLLVFSTIQGLQLFKNEDAFSQKINLLAMILVGLQSILFLMIPNYLHRIWSGVIGIAALTFLLSELGLYPFTLFLLLAAAATIWLQEFTWAKHGSKVQALGYSFVFVCFAHLITQNKTLGFNRFWGELFGVSPLGGALGITLSSLALGIVLLAVVLVLIKRAKLSVISGKGIAVILLAILIAVIGIKAPGITIGLVFVLLGHAHGNKVLTGIGLVTLIAFLSQFYYQLDLTLLQKSLVLFFSGAALIIVRQLMHYFWPKVESKNA